MGVFAADDINTDTNMNILEILENAKADGKKILPIMNKCDIAATDAKYGYLWISAKNNTSADPGVTALQAIENKLEEMFNLDSYRDNIDSGAILTEERQYFEICAALESVKSAVAALKSGFSQDTAGLDLEAAAQSLDRCDGTAVAEDIVSRIFRNFCVGK